MPAPPPFNGATYMVKLLAESDFAREVGLVHLDCGFSRTIGEYTRISPRKLLRFLGHGLALARELVFRRPDYIILTPAFSRTPFIKDALYWLLASAAGSRVILWAHGNGLPRLMEQSGPFMRAFIRLAHKPVRFAVTVGDSLRDNYRGLLSEDRIGYIHNGIPRVEQPDIVEISGFRVLYLSNMIDSKGWRVLYEAAVDLCPEMPDLEVDFHGNPDGTTVEELYRFFASGPFPDRIRYHGPVYGAAKTEAIARCSLFCFPSSFPFEAFPLVNLEAMQAGKPILTTSQGAIAEAVIDGQGGVLVRGNDHTALAAAIRNLASDPDRLDRMGRFNRMRFEEKFTLERFGSSWRALMEEMCRQDGIPAGPANPKERAGDPLSR